MMPDMQERRGRLTEFMELHNMQEVLSIAVNRAVKSGAADPFATISEAILSETLVCKTSLGDHLAHRFI